MFTYQPEHGQPSLADATTGGHGEYPDPNFMLKALSSSAHIPDIDTGEWCIVVQRRNGVLQAQPYEHASSHRPPAAMVQYANKLFTLGTILGAIFCWAILAYY
ncbi:hypothetical protein FA13DRAFT_1798679 [Coprinellus micaceus]|uniref:Uncharacterized protein n=1 Tax=Coprinellus micaceus TaxID=71717 RepID=A0A4Y7SLI1_COPMI|nr:hypothetical protein FA13DRAFT_1798679 [Coprinellus micaceus]